jgi:hypothetical protein
MVFQNRKRRAPAKLQIPKTTSFKDLPDELLLDILNETASISEVLRLRQVSNHFLPACRTAIRDRLKTLYIHPSPRSVKRAKVICNSDISSDIEEVCFVNKIHWISLRAPIEHSKDDEHSWPSLQSHKQFQGFNPAFATHYKSLLSALTSLPKVKMLSFKDKCDRPGFNMVSELDLAAWGFTTKKQDPSRLQKVEKELFGPRSTPYVKPKMAYNFADVDAIFSALNCLNITTLKLHDEVPFADMFTLDEIRLRNLTHIELHIHTGWFACPAQDFSHILLRRAAPTLQTLKLTFQHNKASLRHKRHTREGSLGNVLRGTDEFPELRRLELLASGLPDELPYMGQIFAFVPFIEWRCRKLEYVRTVRVFPTIQALVAMPSHNQSMDLILEEFEGEVEALEEEDEFTRAWKIISMPALELETVGDER